MTPAVSALAERFAHGFTPEPRLTISEWADEYRYLEGDGAAEPGRYRTSRTPYNKEIADNLSPSSPVQETVVMKGTQLGMTEVGNNWVGYNIHHAPGPMLVVQTGEQAAERFSTQRVEPMIRASPALRDLSKTVVGKRRDTVLFKRFPGMVLSMVGSNSTAGLRSMPARYLFLDEIDTYQGDVQGEGNPVRVAEKRTTTFGTRKKVFKISSPKIAGTSRIEAEYETTDKRRYFVPCVHCGEKFIVTWDRVKWDNGDHTTARVECPACGSAMRERHKQAMLAGGEWRPTAVSANPLRRGYQISGLYSPWLTWTDAVWQFIDAQGKPNDLRTWVNSVLGEPWVERGEAPEWQRLYERREADQQIGTVPDGALILTAGVDVQRDRVEAYVWGWGPGLESWLVDYEVFPTPPEDPATLPALTAFLGRRWPRAGGGGSARIERLAIDTGDGMSTNIIYQWCRDQDPYRVMAVKGSMTEAAAGHPLSVSSVDVKDRSGKTMRRGLRLWVINVSVFKSELYQWLRLDRPEDGRHFPAGYVHLPLGLPVSACKQLCAETLITSTTKAGRPKLAWHQSGPNEALDCRVYARAAIYSLGADTSGAAFWSHARQAAAAERRQQAPPPRSAPARGASYMGGFGRMR